MKVVTAGSRYLDIDAYAGCIAYAELLCAQGHEAIAASTAPVNESVTKTILSWGAEIARDYQPGAGDSYSIIDDSTPEYFDTFVDSTRIDAVIDHHPGFETYWQERIGDKAIIETVGAACTQVYEAWVRAGLLDKMTAVSARLLMSGILDNTLNFKAQITTQRDKDAYTALAEIAGLPKDWPAQYFSECQQAIEAHLDKAIKNDTKQLTNNNVVYPGLPDWMGQLVVWDARRLIADHRAQIIDTMSQRGSSWAVNLISISQGVSYIMATDPDIQTSIAKVLNLNQFTDNYTTANRLWLRKEILKASLN